MGARESRGGFRARSLSPQHSRGDQDRALSAASAASELKCTSEEFLFSFWERHKGLFQRLCLCEERSAVTVFFLEAFGGAHLQSISGRGCGTGRLHLGLQTEPGRGGCLVRISPQAPENGPLPHQALGQPQPTDQVDRPHGHHIWHCIPGAWGSASLACMSIAKASAAWGQMVNCRCKRLVVS